MEIDLAEHGDPAPLVLERVAERLQIDEGWITRGDRRFAWVGHRLAQQVLAGPVVEDEGFWLCRVSVTTPILTGVSTATPQLLALIEMVNSVAVGSSLFFEQATCSLRTAFSTVVHAEVLESRAEEIADYCILQLWDAEEKADKLSAFADGRVAVATHPVSGRRQEVDEMLSVVDALIRPKGRERSPFVSAGEFERVETFCKRSPFATAGGNANGISIEVPFGPKDTALIELGAGAEHPALGGGLGVRTTLPLMLGREQRSALASRLFHAQSADVLAGSMIGAWEIGSAAESGYVRWTRFIPNLLFRPGLVLGTATEEIRRAVWVDRHLNGALPPRNAWEILANRLGRLTEQKGQPRPSWLRRLFGG